MTISQSHINKTNNVKGIPVKHLITLIAISAVLVGCDGSPNLEVTTEIGPGTNVMLGNFSEEQLNIVSREREKITINKVIINNDFIAMRTRAFDVIINQINPPEVEANKVAENLKLVNAQIDSLRTTRQYFFIEDSIDNLFSSFKPHSETYFSSSDSAKCLDWLGSDSTNGDSYGTEETNRRREFYKCPFRTTYTYTSRRYRVRYESHPELEMGNKVSYGMSEFCRIPDEKGEFTCENPKGEIVSVLLKTSLGDFSGDIVKNQ